MVDGDLLGGVYGVVVVVVDVDEVEYALVVGDVMVTISGGDVTRGYADDGIMVGYTLLVVFVVDGL